MREISPRGCEISPSGVTRAPTREARINGCSCAKAHPAAATDLQTLGARPFGRSANGGLS